jgi:hypothetical protein
VVRGVAALERRLIINPQVNWRSTLINKEGLEMSDCFLNLDTTVLVLSVLAEVPKWGVYSFEARPARALSTSYAPASEPSIDEHSCKFCSGHLFMTRNRFWSQFHQLWLAGHGPAVSSHRRAGWHVQCITRNMNPWASESWRERHFGHLHVFAKHSVKKMVNGSKVGSENYNITQIN